MAAHAICFDYCRQQSTMEALPATAFADTQPRWETYVVAFISMNKFIIYFEIQPFLLYVGADEATNTIL